MLPKILEIDCALCINEILKMRFTLYAKYFIMKERTQDGQCVRTKEEISKWINKIRVRIYDETKKKKTDDRNTTYCYFVTYLMLVWLSKTAGCGTGKFRK